MARVTFVKKTQQRFKMVPVLDADGNQKRTPVMGRNGEQRKTKTGRLVFMDVTVADKTQPKPDLKCENCDETIPVGAPHKHVTPKSGPYGGRKRVRCAKCPTWQVWDLSHSLSANLARISYDAQQAFDGGVETVDDVEAILSQAAEEIRGLAEEKRDSASNIEEGFGHSTYQSDELNEVADSLESWADDVEQAEVPELPEPEEEDRWYVVNTDGSGDVFEDVPEGYESEDEAQTALDEYLEANADETADSFEIEQREYTPEEPTDDQMDTWRDEAADALSIIDESPV